MAHLLTKVNPDDYTALAIPDGYHSHDFDEAYGDHLR